MGQPSKIANLARGRLNRKNDMFPCSRPASALTPSKLRLNLEALEGFERVCIFEQCYVLYKVSAHLS